MYLLLASTYRCIAWHILPFIYFYHSSMLASVNSSNFTSVLFSHACHANAGANKMYAVSTRIFLCILDESFQIHQPIIVYHSVRIDHNTFLGFLFFIVRVQQNSSLSSNDVPLNLYSLSTFSYEVSTAEFIGVFESLG